MLSVKFISILIIVCSAYAFNENIGKDFIEVDSYKLNWVISDKAVDFVFKTKVSGNDNIWIAFGLSNDRSMVRIVEFIFR